jgi:hypothetical protein
MALASERPAAKLLLFVRRYPDASIGNRQNGASVFNTCADRDCRAGRRVFGSIFQKLAARLLNQTGIHIDQRQIFGEFDSDPVGRQSFCSSPDCRVDDVPWIGPFEVRINAACGHPACIQEILNEAIEFRGFVGYGLNQ